MKKYSLTSQSSPLNMTLAYGKDDFLVSWVVDASSLLIWKQLWQYPPLTRTALYELVGRSKGAMQLAEVPADLSFAAFWDAYAHKQGNKGKVEKLWNALSEADRAAALAALPRYASFLATRPTMEKAFAETWLRNRRWEN